MKIYNLSSATKVLIPNDTDPLGKQTRKIGTQRNKKYRITKNMMKMIKLEPFSKTTEIN